ncbi:alpha/beta hydrolase [Amaricoccus solimangrovi]|uniref:Alpha/beta hydrolase n=1 Tax=Amaricoccus solimangrovi TaxID=2589815 RepID=A0A501WX36_9RHOB|nr:alpha/beta hydrolase [Amaricoccus solimangrovi]TPE50436.1 alpha/beta hydrolase [Amaricoccus solimangrovi]
MSALRRADGYAYAEEAGSEGAPTFLLFHGTGGDERQFTPLARQLLPGARLIAPRGDVSEGGAPRFFRRAAEGVYDMDDLAARTTRMADFVAARKAEGGGPVIGLGYSNGANILASVILARPDLFDAAVLLHPLIPWEPAPVPIATRVLITAGERDPICPAPLTARLARWFEDQGAPTTLHWHPGGHEVDRSEITAISRFLERERGRTAA